MIKIHISNRIYIKGLSEKYVDHIKKTLTLDNPKYWQLMRASGGRARAFYSTPKDFKYFSEAREILIVPRGMRVRLLEFLDKVEEKYTIKEEYVEIKYKV